MSNNHNEDDPIRVPKCQRFSSFCCVSVALLLFATQNKFVTYTVGDLQIEKVQEKKKRLRLEFVHIPKTGGTAIESIAKNANLTWSICHFGNPEVVSKISNGLVECYHNNNIERATKGRSQNRSSWQSGLFWESNRCPWWHVPPAHVQAFYPKKDNPYADADLFAVVRNPYERIISEYYYAMNELENPRNKNTTKHQDTAHFNTFLHKRLSAFSSKMMAGDLSNGIPGNRVYYSHDGHLIPQYDFVYDKVNNRRIIEHVLIFENLHEDFSNLMAEYGLPLELPRSRVRPKSGKKLEVWNLSIQNMLLVEDIYKDDFREFGYDMLSKRRRRKMLRTEQDV